MISLSDQNAENNSKTKKEKNIIVINDEMLLHLNYLSKYLRNDFETQKLFCDVEIISKNGAKIVANSQLLAAFIDNYSNQKQIFVPHLTSESVMNILKWMYNGSVKLKIENLADDLDAIYTLGVFKMREKVEEKLIEIAKVKKSILKILKIASKNLIFIPHSTSIIAHVSNFALEQFTLLFHDQIRCEISYQELLQLSSNSILMMVNCRIDDEKKVNIVNIALKWIYECRASNELATQILRSTTFRQMSYEMLVNFRSSLIQTAVPVILGRYVRIRRLNNSRFDIVFGCNNDMTDQKIRASSSKTKTIKTEQLSILSRSSSLSPDRLSAAQLESYSTRQIKFINKMCTKTSSRSESGATLPDDCTTALSIGEKDLRKFGLKKKK